MDPREEKTREKDGINHFLEMPIELLLEVCHRVGYKDLVTLSTVSKSFNPLALSDEVWYFKFKKFFPDIEINSLKPDGKPFFYYRTFKKLYKKNYQKNSFFGKESLCHLIDGNITALETKKFSYNDFINLITAYYGNYLNFDSFWSKNQFLDQKTLNYLFGKVEKECPDDNPHYRKFLFAITLNQTEDRIFHHLNASTLKLYDVSLIVESALNYKRPELLPLLVPYLKTKLNDQEVNKELGACLSYALINGYIDQYYYLIEQGAEINKMNLAFCFTQVCKKGQIESLKILLDPQNKFVLNSNNFNMGLSIACQFGRLAVLEFLIPILDETFREPLLNTACIHGQMEIINYLETVTGVTSLHEHNVGIVCGEGYLDVLKYIIENNDKFQFNLKEVLSVGLVKAANNGHANIVQYILPQLKALNYENLDPLINDVFIKACGFGYKKIVKYLREEVELKNNIVYKGCKEAIKTNRVAIVRYLCDQQLFDNSNLNRLLIDATAQGTFVIINFILRKTNIKVDFEFNIDRFKSYSVMDFDELYKLFPRQDEDAPLFYVNFEFLWALAQAYHILSPHEEKKAAAFLDLMNLVSKYINTLPVEIIIKEWENSPNSKYKTETNYAIISTHQNSLQQFNAILNSSQLISTMVGMFSKEQADKNRRDSQTPALNLIEDIIKHSRVYNFNKKSAQPKL